MSEIQIVRLQTGEEIIAKVEVSDDSYFLKNPAIILPAGQGKVGLAPYLPYCEISEDGLEIDKKFVMFVSTPVSEFMNQYSTAFGSGLLVPDNTLAGAAPVPAGAASTSEIPTLKLTQ